MAEGGLFQGSPHDLIIVYPFIIMLFLSFFQREFEFFSIEFWPSFLKGVAVSIKTLLGENILIKNHVFRPLYK